MILFGCALVLVVLWYDFTLFVDENYSVCRLYLPSFYYNRTFAVL